MNDKNKVEHQRMKRTEQNLAGLEYTLNYRGEKEKSIEESLCRLGDFQKEPICKLLGSQKEKSGGRRQKAIKEIMAQ